MIDIPGSGSVSQFFIGQLKSSLAKIINWLRLSLHRTFELRRFVSFFESD
jgi:hypothetical protein